MMNKSLALKKKLYLFLSFIVSFFIFLYLFYFLIYGDRGIISYYKIKNQNTDLYSKLNNLEKRNNFLLDRIERLQPNTIDLDFLDEKVREKLGFVRSNEVIIVFDK